MTTTAPSINYPIPSHQDARQFLDCIDSEGSEFFFRAIHPKTGSAQGISGIFDGVKSKLDQLNAAGFGIFVVINAGGQKTRDIIRVRAVFADFDGTPLPAVWPLKPHIVIETSPQKWHAYWLVCGLEARSFEQIQKNIAAQLESDPVVHDLPRVMRLPGYLHTKGVPFRSRPVEIDPTLPRYGPDKITAAFGLVHPTQPTTHKQTRKRPQVANGQPRVIHAGDGCHADVLTLTAKFARAMHEEGLARKSVITMIRAESKRGRWGRDVTDEIERALDSASKKLNSGEWETELVPAIPAWLGTRMQPRAPSPTTDLANGLRLFHEYANDVIYVRGVGFHVWTSTGWSVDDASMHRMGQRVGELVSQDAARTADRAAKADSSDRNDLHDRAGSLHKWAKQSGMTRAIKSALAEFQALVTVEANQLDGDSWLLGTPNGAVNLRTGELHPLTREYLITYKTTVSFNPDAACVLWLDTLAKVLPQKETRDFFQRYAGSLLTGSTEDQKLLIAFGTGANGKSTLFGVIADILGDYARGAPPSLLMKRNSQPHPTELAYLRARRFILASESPQGACLDEERVKLLTGSDRITARGMRQDFFDFSPTHKLALLTNYRPQIRGTDNGIWRRVLMLPFEVMISAREQDPSLPAKLRDEYPGVLAWLVRGCLEYQRLGLSPPSCVRSAISEYREDSDPFARFLDEECVIEQGQRETAANLYDAYVHWTEVSDDVEVQVSRNSFGELLRTRGLKQIRTKKMRMWRGIGLRWWLPNAAPPSG
jgi:P4 family phage/plasmid primase-like protien